MEKTEFKENTEFVIDAWNITLFKNGDINICTSECEILNLKKEEMKEIIEAYQKLCGRENYENS